MGVGLVKSYSRGAWLGAAVGVAYLLLNAEGRRKNAEWGKAESRKQTAEIGRGKAELLKAGRHWLAVAVICASVLVLGFWSFGHAERAVARRAYSVANVNDFSWRNRMAAWEGGLQMMAEKPCFGFGWNQPEWVYNQYYRAAKVDEGMAFQLNGYFMLGATLGVPALLCFLTYVGLSFSPKPKAQSPKSAGGSSGRVLGSSELAKDDGAVATEYRLPITDYWLKTTCRGGAAVLLVGFWFDGGLFKLATAATFWMLLELGREEDHEIHSAAEPQPEELNKLHGLHELHRF